MRSSSRRPAGHPGSISLSGYTLKSLTSVLANGVDQWIPDGLPASGMTTLVDGRIAPTLALHALNEKGPLRALFHSLLEDAAYAASLSFAASASVRARSAAPLAETSRSTNSITAMAALSP